MNLQIEESVFNAVMIEVSKDEYEACFGNYYSDEFWEKEYPGETREQAYEESMKWHKSLTLKELLDYYDDRYDYILEQMNYSKGELK